MNTSRGVAYERFGSGEPLVLIHGIGHRRQAWAPVIPKLTRDYEVIALDLPGFGQSRPVHGDVYGMPTTIEQLRLFFAEIGATRPHVAGSSLGGAIALELGGRDLVRSVTAIAPAGFWSPWQRRYAMSVLNAHRRAARLPDVLLRTVARSPRIRNSTLRLLYSRPERITSEVFLEDSRCLGVCQGFKPTLHAGVDYECLAQPVVPTTVAWGAKDRILWPSQGKLAASRLPSATHVELPGCGHVPMTDDPDGVAVAIRHTARLSV